ncbi:hypothetical protein L195_g044003, partial [Trifolium pratense]
DVEDGPTRMWPCPSTSSHAHVPRAPPTMTRVHSSLSLILDKWNCLTQDDEPKQLAPTFT